MNDSNPTPATDLDQVPDTLRGYIEVAGDDDPTRSHSAFAATVGDTLLAARVDADSLGAAIGRPTALSLEGAEVTLRRGPADEILMSATDVDELVADPALFRLAPDVASPWDALLAACERTTGLCTITGEGFTGVFAVEVNRPARTVSFRRAEGAIDRDAELLITPFTAGEDEYRELVDLLAPDLDDDEVRRLDYVSADVDLPYHGAPSVRLLVISPDGAGCVSGPWSARHLEVSQ